MGNLSTPNDVQKLPMASHAKDGVKSCPRAGCGKSARPVVCPAKAGMFGRRKASQGKSRKPRSLDSGVPRHTSTLPKPAKLKSWSYAASPTDQIQAAAVHRATLQAYIDIDRLAVIQLPIPPSPATRSVRSVLAEMRSFSCCHIACN